MKILMNIKTDLLVLLIVLIYYIYYINILFYYNLKYILLNSNTFWHNEIEIRIKNKRKN
jgi:hypothetical protein